MPRLGGCEYRRFYTDRAAIPGPLRLAAVAGGGGEDVWSVVDRPVEAIAKAQSCLYRSAAICWPGAVVTAMSPAVAGAGRGPAENR